MDGNHITLDSGSWMLLMILVVFYCLGAIFRGSSAKPRTFDAGTKLLVTAIALKASMQLMAFLLPMLDSRGAISAFTFFWSLIDFVVVVFGLLSLRSLLLAFLHAGPVQRAGSAPGSAPPE